MEISALWTHVARADRLNGSQMPRLLFAPLILLVVSLGVVACNGNGNGDKDDDGGKASPTADSSPTAEATAGTATPAASVTTGRISPPENVGDFLNKFSNKSMTRADCEFVAESEEADCGDNGRYTLDPPPPDAAAKCEALVADGEAIGVACTSQEPLTVTYYEIPE